jgi:hypothetical protein
VWRISSTGSRGVLLVFVHMPSVDLTRLAQYFHASMVAFFLMCSLINERLAKSMLGRTHSCFSLDMSVKIP